VPAADHRTVWELLAESDELARETEHGGGQLHLHPPLSPQGGPRRPAEPRLRGVQGGRRLARPGHLPFSPDPWNFGAPPKADGDPKLYVYEWNPSTKAFEAAK
jgi:hypothetical protein